MRFSRWHSRSAKGKVRGGSRASRGYRCLRSFFFFKQKTAYEIEIPREAMGRGDLKFLACIGAFLGWRAVLFAIFAGSLYGSAIGLVTLILGKRVWSLKRPFGPYLALGAITWIFCGDPIVHWYQTFLLP